MSTHRTPAPRQILDGTLLRLIQPSNGGMTKAQEYLDEQNRNGMRLAILGTNLAVFEEVPQAPAPPSHEGPRPLLEDKPTA